MKKILVFITLLVFCLASCTAPSPQESSNQDDVEQLQQEKEELEQQLKEIQEQQTTVEKAEEASEPETEVVVIEEQVEETTSNEPEETPPSPVAPEVTVVESTEIDPQTKELLEKADKKIKSFSYTLAPAPDQLARDKWKVKGTKIRIDLYDDNYVEPDTYYDTVLIDTELKTATGFCLSQRTTRCAEPGQRFELDFNDVYKKTPYQWIKETTGTPKIISSEVVYDRRVAVIEYQDGSDTIRQWVDQFSGLPIRIELNGERTSRTEYRYLAINDVLDSDLVPQ